jgi:hypothetical protein
MKGRDAEMLKPLGTLITVAYPPDTASTSNEYSIIRYRVVDYVLALNPETLEEELMEKLEVLSVEKRLPVSMSYIPKQVIEWVPKWRYV